MTTLDAGASPVPADGAPEPHAVRLEAAGTQPEGVIHEVGGLYGGRGWSAHATEHPFTYRYTAVGDAAVTLRRSRITGAIRGAIPHTDDYVVQWLTEGTGVPDVRQDRVPMRIGTPMLFPSDREFVFAYEDYDQRLVHLSRELVHEVSAERFHTGQVTDLALDHLRELDAEAVARWRRQMTLLAQELRHGVGTLLWHTLTREAASAFLDLYPPAAPELPAVVLLPRKARLRAAVGFVHEHLDRPLSVADIADAAGLSIRAVQEAFQRDLDTTPMNYVRRVRLERVRIELHRSDPATTSVQDVARRWGFAHLGRFASEYLRAVGEYPRQTLRR